MGAVGLTFVVVAVFLGFIVKRGEQGEPGRPVVESVLPADVGALDAAPLAVAPPDAGVATAGGELPGDAGLQSDAGLAESDPADAASAVAVASAAPKKPHAPTKAKLKQPQRWRPKHR
jgi:hypothetical protein